MDAFLDFITELFAPAGMAGPHQTPIYMIGYETWWATVDPREHDHGLARDIPVAAAEALPMDLAAA